MYDLVVIGGGPGGLSVATAGARLGARVALVEKHALGGECTHTACVPSKALLEAARLAHQIRGAAGYGLRVVGPEVDFAAVMGRVRAVVTEFGGTGTGDSLRARGIDVFLGTPSFEAYDTVVIDGRTRLNAQRFVIATGSRAAVPAIAGLAEVGYLDNNSIWGLDALPAELVILGAGPTGIEFAQAFTRLGSKVSVVCDSTDILPGEDPEVSVRVQALLAAEGIEFRTGVAVTGVARRDGRIVCTMKGQGEGPGGGAPVEVSGTHLLVAAGRLANVEGLNLEGVGIHADPVHGIEVDEYLQTHSSRIYAIGDVLQKHDFTHSAEREAAIVVQNTLLRIPRKIDYSALPWATFIDPEVATVGLTEAAARAQNPEVRVLRAELSEADRARIEGHTDGFAKVMVAPSGKILGATIFSPEAALVLQEFVLAMEHGLTLQDIAETVHPYPTYAGLAKRLANEFLVSRREASPVQRALRWFRGYQVRTGDEAVTAASGVADSAPGHGHGAPAGQTNGHGHGHGHGH
jgi:pyruvate/2-oxoglutarate dehydrogenase complex dihydrolipoamide dehydrogenase (E3) component